MKDNINKNYYHKINFHTKNTKKGENIRNTDININREFIYKIQPNNRKTITLSTIDTNNSIKNYDSINNKKNTNYNERNKNRTEEETNINKIKHKSKKGYNNIHFNSNYSEPNKPNYNNNIIVKESYDKNINQNNLFVDNQLNYNKTELKAEDGFKLTEYNSYSKKKPKYHYKLLENGNKTFKNNQLINNGIENKNYKFNKNIIQNIIKLKLNNQKKLSLFSTTDNITNIKEKIKKAKIKNENQFLINMSPKNALNNLSNSQNLNINNFNNQMNDVTNYYILNNNIRNDTSEEEIYYNEEYENEENYYDSNNIYTYFEEPEIIKEVNEDMEESSSDNKIVKKINDDKINKSIKKYKNEEIKSNYSKKKNNNIIYCKTEINNSKKVIKKKNNTFMIKSNISDKKKNTNKKIIISKRSKFGKKSIKKEGNKNSVLNCNKNNFKNGYNFVINNNNYNYSLENLKKYVKNEMTKLRLIKPPIIYNFFKNKR